MELAEQLEGIAARAAGHAEREEVVTAVIPAESSMGRVYLCAYRRGDDETTWLLLDTDGEPVVERAAVRDAASLVALAELAEDSAGGGELDELRSRLVGLRLTENPPGLDEAIAAVDELERTIGRLPRIASTAHLERVGAAVRKLEEALGSGPGSPFAAAMKSGAGAVQEFTADVEANYKRQLS
ncbi:MAG TPA: hypothetical protein VKA45_15785 [Gaiellaceae bacterium]|nr:hypothetical protein [Gaiellaceae bacterium]